MGYFDTAYFKPLIYNGRIPPGPLDLRSGIGDKPASETTGGLPSFILTGPTA